MAREALEGRFWGARWGELIPSEAEPQAAVSGGCWGAEHPGWDLQPLKPSALQRLRFEGGDRGGVGLNPSLLWEGAQMHSH